MKKKFIKIIIAIIVSLLTTSCSGQSYYKKVKKNIKEFEANVNTIIQKKMLVPDDSISLKGKEAVKFNTKCLYVEDSTDLLALFMKKYQLKRICFVKYNNEFFDSAINFHREFTPFMGNAAVITYDFGQSRLRDMVNKKIKLKNEDVKIMNKMFLYREDRKPSLGE